MYGPHTGNDEACKSGTPVYAAGDGVVEFAGEFDDTYADNLLWLLRMGGNVLVLNCGEKEPSFVYAHLSRFHVKRGDSVRKGQLIADSGNSGTATTGPHLHVEAIAPGYVLNSPMLGRVNPDIYLTEWPEDIPALIQVHSITQQATETVEDDFMSALSAEEQREMLGLLRMLPKMLDNIAASQNEQKPEIQEVRDNVRKDVLKNVYGQDVK